MISLDSSLRRHILFGGVCSLALLLGIGGWAVFTNLSGAVVAMGTVSLEGQTKKVQHPTGGIVSQIMVKEGQKVKLGEVLLTLDETAHKAAMQISQKQMDESIIRIARLETEEKGLLKPIWPDQIKAKAQNKEITAMIKAELDLFDSRYNATSEQKKQLQEKITQSEKEISGLSGQLETRKTESGLIHRELKSVEDLEKKGYATLSRMITLKRDYARIEGDRLNLLNEIEKSNSRLQEAKVILERLTTDTRKEISTELRDVKVRLNELTERFISAEDMYNRAQMKSPIAGFVHQLTANTIGGVVQPGESVMTIVPENELMIVEAKIAQSDIDQVKIGEKALIRFTAFNQRTTPELNGKVSYISSDLTKDREANYMQQMPYYTVRMNIPSEEMTRLDGKTLQLGMGAEIYIHTETRSAISYFMKPITDQFKRAFKER